MKATQLFVTAAIAAFALAGCSKNESAEDQNTGVSKTVTVHVASVASRAAGKDKVTTGYKTPINNVTLYFLDGNDRVVSPALTMGGSEITNGKTFSDISPSAVKIYVVANTENSDGSGALFPALASVNLNSSKSTIENMAAASVTQMNNSAMGIDNTVLSGENSFTAVSGTNYTVAVTLVPAVCRFEITSITSDQSNNANKVDVFDLSGIYLNTYYTQFTIGGGYVAGGYYGVSTTEAQLGSVADHMKDTNLNKTGATSYSSVTGDATKVWAYMLPVGNTPPMIVFKLDNVSLNGTGMVPSTRYVTVKQFKDHTTGEFITLKRGEVYVVRDVLFGPTDITENPNDQKINITVSVDVRGWQVYAVDPVL